MANNTNSWQPRVMPMTYAVLEIIVAIVAVFGNSLVIVAFCVEKKLRKLTNYYIFSLSVADLLVGFIGIPSALLTKIGLPMNAFYPCVAMLSALMVLCTVSILNLLAVSLDRYWAILYPFWYHTSMNGRAVTCIIIACWFFGSILGFLPLFGWNNGPEKRGQCLFIPIISYRFLVFIYFGTIVLPSVLMAFSYFRIYRIVLRQLRKTLEARRPYSHYSVSASKSNSSKAENGSFNKDKKRTFYRSFMGVHWREVSKAKDLSVIVLLFMLCWLPLYTCNCILAFCNECHLSVPMMEFFIVLSHANSAINPFLYACQMKDFRTATKTLLTCRQKPKSNTDVSSVSNQTIHVSIMDTS